MALAIYGQFQRLLLEAEVAPNAQSEFEAKYLKLTGISPIGSEFYQDQPNKWGAELRVYFDAPTVVVESLTTLGYHIEDRREGYRGDFDYRINSETLFWKLVQHGYRLGPNVPIPSD